MHPLDLYVINVRQGHARQDGYSQQVGKSAIRSPALPHTASLRGVGVGGLQNKAPI